jgi:hypothetical protein
MCHFRRIVASNIDVSLNMLSNMKAHFAGELVSARNTRKDRAVQQELERLSD